jgi:hypothetical protein
MKSIIDIADDIEKYAIQTARLLMTYNHLRINLHNSPLYNFRDALSHYIRLYEATANDDKICQETSISEHLSRGIKDACFTLIDNMKGRITDILKDLFLNKEKEQIFRKQLHLFKCMEIELRKNSIMLSIGDLTPLIDNLITAIRDTKNLFINHSFKFETDANITMPE